MSQHKMLTFKIQLGWGQEIREHKILTFKIQLGWGSLRASRWLWQPAQARRGPRTNRRCKLKRKTFVSFLNQYKKWFNNNYFEIITTTVPPNLNSHNIHFLVFFLCSFCQWYYRTTLFLKLLLVRGNCKKLISNIFCIKWY